MHKINSSKTENGPREINLGLFFDVFYVCEYTVI